MWFRVSVFLKDDLSGPKNPKQTCIGSEPWHCKEVLESGPITDKADIFAYGLTIWEMLALDVPHVHLMREMKIVSVKITVFFPAPLRRTNVQSPHT